MALIPAWLELQDADQQTGHAAASRHAGQCNLTDHLNSTASASQGSRGPRVLLGASGSVAAIKIMELAHLLAAFAEVKIVATKAARHFIQEDELPAAVRPLHGKTHCLSPCS